MGCAAGQIIHVHVAESAWLVEAEQVIRHWLSHVPPLAFFCKAAP